MAHIPLNTKTVVDAARRLGRPVTVPQAKKLVGYLEHLVKWNKKMNLVGPTRWWEIFDTLIVDSLYLADFLAGLRLREAPLTLDLGAGAGLPGLPLRVFWEAGDYWLVEVREKRSLFMRSALGRMGLENTFVFHGKAEDALERLEGTGNNATADLILSKAFMPWPRLLEFVRPMVHAESVVVILSNDSPPEENELPEGWMLGDVASYPVARKEHFFWSLRVTE